MNNIFTGDTVEQVLSDIGERLNDREVVRVIYENTNYWFFEINHHCLFLFEDGDLECFDDRTALLRSATLNSEQMNIMLLKWNFIFVRPQSVR